jgi:hypothetical protein
MLLVMLLIAVFALMGLASVGALAMFAYHGIRLFWLSEEAHADPATKWLKVFLIFGLPGLAPGLIALSILF